MTFFPASVFESNGCETCLNTDLKFEHYSVRVWIANLNMGLVPLLRN